MNLKSFFASLRPLFTLSAKKNQEIQSNIIAFGDVHGYDKAAASAVDLAETLNVKAIFLGDYVDRGPFSMKTLLVLADAKQRHPEWEFLLGNHE